MKGRRPKPTQLKKLQGNPGQRPLNHFEPKPKGEVKKPYGMATQWPQVSKRWDQIAGELETLGILTNLDAMAFRRLLESDWIASEALTAMRLPDGTLNLTRLDENKVERKNPNLVIYRQALQDQLKILGEFGMTPSSRSRIRIDEPTQLTLGDILAQAVFKEDE